MTYSLLSPPLFPTAFAEGAGATYITNSGVLPTASQIGITNGAASLVDGFPPLNFALPISLGGSGVPVSGQDLNAVLYMITANMQFINSGQRYKFDSGLSTAIGGYPVGAILQSNDGTKEFINVLASNTTDFNSTPSAIGVSWILFGSTTGGLGTLISEQYITSTGTYSKAINSPSFIIVEGWGAGGGGGGVTAGNDAGGGGGSGGYFKKKILASALASSETITIGAAGTAGTTAGSAGGSGGTTSFGAWASATGGSGGAGCTSQTNVLGGAPGAGSGADLNLTGQAGFATASWSGGSRSGEGGCTTLGGNGQAAAFNSTGNTAVSNSGSGGSGGSAGTSTARAGGAGGSGFMIIREYR